VPAPQTPSADPGPAAVPTLLDVLDLEEIDRDLYRSTLVTPDRFALYGGQVAAQALHAAGLTVPDGRLPHSLHGYFLRSGDARRPAVFRVDRDRDGRSFSARRVTAVQDGEAIFTMSASFVAPAGPERPMLDHEAEPVPAMPPLDSLASQRHPKHVSFEFRALDPGPRLPPAFWLRCTDELPADPLVHAAALAYISDASSALISLETESLHTGPSIDHAVWFHRPVRMDEWTWHDLALRTVAGGRGYYTTTIYAPDGNRVATAAQEQIFAPRR
jgi:acyl-CoA thioesterase-2